MKNRKAVFLGGALAILGGAGLILGNQILVSNVLASGAQTEPAIVVPENESAALQFSNVGMYRNTNGETYMALKNTGLASEDTDLDIRAVEEQPTTTDDIPSSQNENPTDGNLSEEEAKQIGISAIVEKYGLTQKDIDAFDLRVRCDYSTTVNKLLWTVSLKAASLEDNPAYMYYSACFDDKLEDDIYVYRIPLSKKGTPLANEISSDKAKEIGIAALVKKYALTQETLDRFTVTTKYYEVTQEVPDKHVWRVILELTNTDEFAEIGSYWTFIDAETGDALQLMSAVDGKG